VRENQAASWGPLAPRLDCVNAELSPGTYRCCSDSIGDFGLQLYKKSPDRAGSSTYKDKFKGRLTIGPLFLVIFDIYLFTSLFLGLIAWRTRQSFQLEFTGLYPSNEQKKEIKA
jgi:hypothetical protein